MREMNDIERAIAAVGKCPDAVALWQRLHYAPDHEKDGIINAFILERRASGPMYSHVIRERTF